MNLSQNEKKYFRKDLHTNGKGTVNFLNFQTPPKIVITLKIEQDGFSLE